MSDPSSHPPLRELHASLKTLKISHFEKLSTDVLIASLAPGSRDSLKARADGTIIDGHHRVHVLRARGVDVDALPRVIIEKKES